MKATRNPCQDKKIRVNEKYVDHKANQDILEAAKTGVVPKSRLYLIVK